MRLHIVSSTKDKTISGNVAWNDGALTSLGTKPADDFVDSLLKSSNPKMGLLPPAVRWLSSDKRIIVFERPPTYQRISYFELERESIRSAKHEAGAIQYMLPMPWLVYVMGFGLDYQPVTIRVYMRPEPICDLADLVFLFPMLNFYTNSKLCNPIFGKFEAHDSNVGTGVHLAYNTVWNSGFNYDLTDAVKLGMQHNSPYASIDSRGNSLLNGWPRSIRAWFSQWSNTTLGDILAAKFVNPSMQDNNSPIHPEGVTLKDAIQAVHDELFHNMGSANISKNLITSLVNNFNLV